MAAKRKYRLAVTIGVVDQATSIPEERNEKGWIIRPASAGLRHIPAGEEVELDQTEGDRLVDRFGTFDQPCVWSLDNDGKSTRFLKQRVQPVENPDAVYRNLKEA